MKDIRVFSILINIFGEQPLFPTNPMLIQQVLDGLLRMLHHLPEHVRTDLHTSLQIFAARFKLKETILPMALIINVAAIAQPPLPIDQGAPPFSDSVISAMLTDPLSDARHITDDIVQQLHAPRVSCSTATALVVRKYLSARKRKRLSGVLRDNRPGRRHLRPSSERRPAAPSTSTVTLEDLQRTTATLQSQVDHKARLARRDIPGNERTPSSTAYYIQPVGPPADALSSDEEPPVYHHAFGLRAVPDSADYAKDNKLLSCFYHSSPPGPGGDYSIKISKTLFGLTRSV